MILQILNRFFLTSTKVQGLKFDMYFEFVKQTVLEADSTVTCPANRKCFLIYKTKIEKTLYNQINNTLHLWVSQCLGT